MRWALPYASARLNASVVSLWSGLTTDELTEDAVDRAADTWLMDRAEVGRHDTPSSPWFAQTTSRVRSDGAIECSRGEGDGRRSGSVDGCTMRRHDG